MQNTWAKAKKYARRRTAKKQLIWLKKRRLQFIPRLNATDIRAQT
jgi:hypothetical protein